MTLFSQLLTLPTVPLKTEENIQMKEILETANLDWLLPKGPLIESSKQTLKLQLIHMV